MLDGARPGMKYRSDMAKTNLDGRFQFKKNGLRDEDLASLGAEETDL